MPSYEDFEIFPASEIYQLYDLNKDILLECKNKNIDKFNEIFIECIINNDVKLVRLYLSELNIDPNIIINIRNKNINFIDGGKLIAMMFKHALYLFLLL